MTENRKRSKTTVGTIDREVLAYTAGRDLELDLHLVEADCLGTAAHVTMLCRMPLPRPVITAAEAARVVAELVNLLREARRGAFRIRPSDQDVHLAVERTLTERLGDTGKKIHTGRSRNDQVAVDLRLYARDQLLGAMDEAAALAETLVRFGRRHAALPMVGRTHMQPAMPSSVGLWATAHAESLLDDLALLITAYELNDQCPLGSAASYGVPLPIDRHLTASLLGFSRPIHNVLYANNARGKMESIILSALGQVMLTLSRLAQDLILFTMPEFGYFELPRAFCTGSSIMPQKSNPDVLELLRAKAARVLACASSVQEILRGAPTGYNRDLQETKEPFLEGFATARASLRILVPLIAQTVPRREALRAAFTPDVFATDAALDKVAAGMPFRDAYHEVKAHLDALGREEPEAVLARKTHWGAPAGLDFEYMGDRVREAQGWVKQERASVARALRKLLGVAYPVQ